MSEQNNFPDEHYEALASLVFELDETYHIGLTNSPDMHPGSPTVSDFYQDLKDGLEKAGFAPVRKSEGDDDEL